MTDVPEQPLAGALAPGVVGLVFFGGIWALFLVPYLRGIAAGRRSGDWWTPFARRADGSYGILAASRWFASFRAPDDPAERTRRGLRVRWSVWTYVVLGLAVLPLWSVWLSLEILLRR
jgi:hypothetical protein